MRLAVLLGSFLFASVACGETLCDFRDQTLPLPFATEKDIDRVYEDFPLKADLTAFDQFQLTIDVQNPSAIGNITLYFHSGDGWYSFVTPTLKSGMQTLTFDKVDPMSEGKPAGFDKVDKIRVSFWKGEQVDSSVKFVKLDASTHSILFVVSGGEDARRAAFELQRTLRKNGIPFVRCTENELNVEKLKGRSILLASENIQAKIPEGTFTRISYLSDGSLKSDDQIEKDIVPMLGAADPEIWRILMEKKKEAIESLASLSSEASRESRSNFAALKLKAYSLLLHQYGTESPFSAEDYQKLCDLYDQLVSLYMTSLPSKPNEFRAWWEHAGTGAYPGDWNRTMKELSENGFNTVIPNMLWGGLAHYPSDLLPRSETFNRYGDQIAQAVEAGKKYGVAVHVWKVNFNGSTAPKEFIDAMRDQGRLQVKLDGEETPWLCPSHPLNRKLERDTMLEVAEKYDVDGVHYDYIRYPGDEYCFCNGCKDRFMEHLRSNRLLNADETLNWPGDCGSGRLKPEYDQWRCDQITALVADVHAAVKEKKLKVKISAAVFPQYPQCRQWVLQEWPLWVERGYLDFICPMDYTTSPIQFSGYVKSQLERTGHKIPIYPGIGATATGIALKPEEVALQINLARQNGADGFTIFNLNRETISVIPPALATGPTKVTQ